MFFAILIGFSLVTFVHSLAYGSLETIKLKAARYFSGHISITGYGWGDKEIPDADELIDQLNNADLPVRTVVPRTVSYKTNASLFFAGNSIRQRRLVGIDFEAEQREFSSFDFLDGSIDAMLDGEENGILISEVAAKILGARSGDSLMLYLTTDTGQYNTATLYVKGIFRETSLFGYVAYMRQKDLNRLLVQKPDFATDIAIYTKAGVNNDLVIEDIRNILSENYNVLPRMQSKNELYRQLDSVDWREKRLVLAPLTLEAHLNQIKTIFDAVLIVTWFVLVLFMLIIMVGILNTYRVMVYERTSEIGTLRSLGMQRSQILGMFLLEAFFLDIIASFSGFVISYFLMKFIGIIDISRLPGAGLFTERGHITPHIDPVLVFLTLLLMLSAVLIAAFGPAYKASRMAPAQALRVDN